MMKFQLGFVGQHRVSLRFEPPGSSILPSHFRPSRRVWLGLSSATREYDRPVVVRNAAPTKGNGSAINQIRTNEIALRSPWELREFTLDDQTFGCETFTGRLRCSALAVCPKQLRPGPSPSADADSAPAREESVAVVLGTLLFSYIIE